MKTGMALRLATVIAVAAGTLSAQTHAASVPHDGYLFDPLVVADAGCVRDLARAAHDGGITERKAVADLLKYGCLKQMKGIYTAMVGSHPNRMTIDGVAYIYASLMFDVETVEILDPDPAHLPQPDDLILNGFVLESKIDGVTRAQLMAKLLKEKKNREEKDAAETAKP